MPKKLRSEATENVREGRQPWVVHSTSDLTPAATSACHTMAQAPYPLMASAMPATPPSTSPSVLATATMRTSMRFIRRLTCTMEDALSMNPRNITLDRGIMRSSPPKQSAMSGAEA